MLPRASGPALGLRIMHGLWHDVKGHIHGRPEAVGPSSVCMTATSDDPPARLPVRERLGALAASALDAATPVVAPTVPADTAATAVLAVVAAAMTVASLAGWATGRPAVLLVGWPVVAAAIRGPWVAQLAAAVVVLEAARIPRRFLARWLPGPEVAIVWLGCLTGAVVLTPPVLAVTVLAANLAVWLAVPTLVLAATRRRIQR